MPSVVLCFHAHLPLQLKKYSFFDIGHSQDYFDEEESRQVLERMAKDCYLPVNAALLKLIRRNRGRFKVSCSVSGTLLEQLEKGQKAVLASFRRLADTGSVEFLSEPYHHSLAFLFSEAEFRDQVALQRRKVRTLFGQAPRAFRNTGLLYGNDIARIAESMGFRVILAGGAQLAGCDATIPWRPAGCKKLKVLFGYDRPSGDTPLRCAAGAGNGQEHRADEHARRLAGAYQNEEIINLFMDYEAFGEHCRGNTGGILDFLEPFPAVLLRSRGWRFLTPSDAAAELVPLDTIDAPGHVWRAGNEKDGAAWLENHMQKDAAHTLYDLEATVREGRNRKRIGVWRDLQASEHFCRMNTTGLSDGAHPRTLTPFASPYDAYISYMNILKDFSGRLAGKTGVRP